MEKPNTSQGNPPDKTDIYETLFVFIDDVLFQFKPFSKDTKGYLVTAENLITQDIEKVLSDKAHTNNTSFAFQNQHTEGLFSTDISVYKRASYKDFCWIEAKRLPTPSEKDRDEREYVFVSQEKINGKRRFKGNGGIQRFKEGKHAENLSYSIMIGYIQDSNNADYWLAKINQWITELTNTKTGLWCEDDGLNKYNSNKCDRFLSSHKRMNKTIMTLHHYWIKL